MNARLRLLIFMKRYAFYLSIAAALIFAAYFGYFYYLYGNYASEIWGIKTSEIINENARSVVRNIQIKTAMAKNIYFSLVLIFLVIAAMIAYIRESQENNRNIVERLEWTINRLSVMEGLQPNAKASDNADRWPWGSHHTDALGHLEAAASRFWKLYDPTDQSTAPTNEMVAEWLRGERSVSKEKAYAIASILRADGLKTGPRR